MRGPAARVADDDLAVEERALGDPRVAQLGEERKEVAAAAVGEANAPAVVREDRADAVPLHLEQVIR